MKPYTYLIGWTNKNKWYYGSRYCKSADPIELFNPNHKTPYLTSSKIVKDFILENGMPDVIQIRKTFKSPKDSRRWEAQVLKRINAKANPKFLNRHNGSDEFCWSGPHSKSTKDKITKSLSGRIFTTTHLEKLSKASKGKAKSFEHVEALKKSHNTENYILEARIRKYLRSKSYLFSITNIKTSESFIDLVYNFCQKNNLGTWPAERKEDEYISKGFLFKKLRLPSEEEIRSILTS